MKKQIFLSFVVMFLLSSCVGNVSLWGQYLTPTPIGWIPKTQTPTPTITLTETITATHTPLVTNTPEPTVTPTAIAQFVTEEVVVETPIEATATIDANSILYYAQNGDWLPAVASRFGVGVNEIASPKSLPENGFIDPGTLLIIPDRINENLSYTSSAKFIPDSEVVFSGTASGFDVDQYVKDAGGHLATYREYLGTTAWTTGSDAIERLAFENSINPRLLLALLDYEANWVRGEPQNEFRTNYPMGQENYRNRGMFSQMIWASNQLSAGYYGWRMGTLDKLTFSDGQELLLDPTLNAGTVAVMNLFSKHHTLNEWLRIMDENSGFPKFYRDMFGDPFARDEAMGNLFPSGLSQPELSLPIQDGTTWAFTGGPHSAWAEGPLAAVDFAPENDSPGCFTTLAWVVAMAPGIVTRSANGVVVVDLDGDGSEQTGWNIMYLHIADEGRVPLGEWVDQDGKIGHPSCEGGKSTGTHTHIARKYNGEWMLADGPIPFVMDSWRVVAGEKPYLGKLINGTHEVVADVYGQSWSLISRKNEE